MLPLSPVRKRVAEAVSMNWSSYHGSSYCCDVGDRYDDKPTSSAVDGRQLDEIEEWNDGKKSVVNEAVDKVKDLWNRAHGRRGLDDDAYR